MQYTKRRKLFSLSSSLEEAVNPQSPHSVLWLTQGEAERRQTHPPQLHSPVATPWSNCGARGCLEKVSSLTAPLQHGLSRLHMSRHLLPPQPTRAQGITVTALWAGLGWKGPRRPSHPKALPWTGMSPIRCLRPHSRSQVFAAIS